MAARLGLEFDAMVRESVASCLGANAVRSDPPDHLLSDEKFAVLERERIYLFLVSQAELVWYGEWMAHTDEVAFTEVIGNFLAVMDDAARVCQHLDPEEDYVPICVTTDGWQPAQTGWEVEVHGIDLIECHLHGRKRVTLTLDDYAKAHYDLSSDHLQQVKDDLNGIFSASSLASFSQRIRRNIERYRDDPILLKRLNILKQKRFLFTNYLKFEDASACSTPLDRSMRFLDEKLQTFGQFRAFDAIDPMLNAWAIVNNLRSFLPDAQKAGQSLAEFFGAKLKGIPWMEALNLCTVGTLDKLLPVSQ